MKPHLGHLYSLPNLRHFPSRLIWISPQLGQGNFVASPAGGMGFPQLVQVTSDNDDACFSAIALQLLSLRFLIVRLLYICCAWVLGVCCFWFGMTRFWFWVAVGAVFEDDFAGICCSVHSMAPFYKVSIYVMSSF